MSNLTKSLLLVLATTFYNYLSYGQTTSSKKLINSLNKLIVPIEANEFLTKNAFKRKEDEIFKYSIVGLGEGTHGTSDFFKIKSQIIKYGIENHSLKLIMIEESLGNTFLLNEYVLKGKGDAKGALNFFGAWIYRVNEVLELVEYVKKYNEKVSDNSKVSFLGFDVQSIKGCLLNLQEILPQKERTTNTIKELQTMDKSYKLYTFWNDTIVQKVDYLIKELEEASNQLEPIKKELIKLNLLNTKQLWLSGDWKKFYGLRDSLMYHTVLKVRQMCGANKVVLWGHNGHIMKYISDTENLKYQSLGYLLSRNNDVNYYSIGFDFNKGGFKAFDEQERKHTNFFVNEADSGSTASVFKNLKYSSFFLSLDEAIQNKEVNKFLLKQPFYRQVQATYDKSNDTEKGYTARDEKANLWEYYNGWIYVNETKPSFFIEK
ncbi:hypothetical protein AD998_15980 [bacterium 336/3]|nr:hypothetical protein AD998_15980 [bacterium 336/3]